MARRDLLRQGMQALSALPVLSLVAGHAKAAEQCTDTSSESLRSSLHYSDTSPNPAQTCSACGFFATATDKPGCGNCAIMSDHVDPKGHCDSWAAKS